MYSIYDYSKYFLRATSRCDAQFIFPLMKTIYTTFSDYSSPSLEGLYNTKESSFHLNEVL